MYESETVFPSALSHGVNVVVKLDSLTLNEYFKFTLELALIETELSPVYVTVKGTCPTHPRTDVTLYLLESKSAVPEEPSL